MRYIGVFFLVLLFACSSGSRTATPSITSTSTVTSGPTLGPAGVPSPNESPSLPAVTVASTPQLQLSAVATDLLNVRAGPGLDYAVKSQLKEGDTMTIIGKSADGLWWQISAGWVSGTYVKVNGDPTAVPVRTPSP